MTDTPLSTPRIWTASDHAEPELHELAGGRACVYSARCPGHGKPNEDAAALIPVDEETMVLALADGAGGSPLGGTAAKVAVERVVEAVSRGDARHPARERILQGIDKANRAVLDLGVGAATTLVVAEIGPTWVRTYHVGDSAVLVTGQKGKVKLLTMAHSPVGYAQSAGLLDEVAALHHEDRNLVSNIIGAADMHVEISSPLDLAERDTLLLGSDGLFDNLTTAEIVDLVRVGQLDAAGAALLSACQKRMTSAAEGEPSKPDDLTFVLFRR